MRLESSQGQLVRGWNRVAFPRELVTQPFGYIYVKPIFAIG
jgi:hypothetical protein